MKRTTITLPEELAELIAVEARRRETSVSAVIRDLVVEGLGGTEEKPREIPWAGLVDDPRGVPGEEIESFLAESWSDAIDRDRG